MYTISDTMHVNAPIDRCFLLSTNVDLVAEILRMRPVFGRTEGLVQSGDQVRWHGWKFALPQFHESLITAYDRPHHFQDSMTRGRFKRFHHDHNLAEIDGHTLLHDKVRFSLPLGPLGDLVAKYVMVPYISRVLHQRLQALKRIAETDEWRKYLPDEAP